MDSDQYKFQMAIHDFQSARQRAAVQEIFTRTRGNANQLLSAVEKDISIQLYLEKISMPAVWL